jgi:hypothetical protein
MNRENDRVNEKVRRLCRAINNRADDRKKLQPLVAQLQDVLQEERYETRAVKVMAQSDNPFDKILLV